VVIQPTFRRLFDFHLSSSFSLFLQWCIVIHHMVFLLNFQRIDSNINPITNGSESSIIIFCLIVSFLKMMVFFFFWLMADFCINDREAQKNG